MRLIVLAAAVVVLAAPLSSSATAADDGKGGNVVDAVAPYLDRQTLAVVRVDLIRVDPAAAEGWLVERLNAAEAGARETEILIGDLRRARPVADQWLGAMRKAGGRELFVLVRLDDLLTAPPIMIVPLGEGADAEQIAEVLAPQPAPEVAPYGFDPRRAERVGDVVALGKASQLKRLREPAAKPDDRADFKQDYPEALAAAGDAAIRVAVVPPPDARRAMEELLPTLPPELGGGSVADAARGLRWVSFAIRPPPTPSLALVIRGRDAAAAEALGNVLRPALTLPVRAWMETWGPIREPDRLAVGELLAALTLAPQGDRLVLSLDDAQLRRLAGALAAGPVARARANALAAASENNIRQLIVAAYTWAEAHNGAWPEQLADAVRQQGLPARLLENPQRPGTSYTYLRPRPTNPPRNPADVVVLYETEPSRGARNVGFQDGRTMWMQEPQFAELLKAGGGK